MQDEIINLDYAASGVGGNPSAIHQAGVRAKELIDQSIARIAEILHAEEDEVFITSGGTESNNWAIKGVMDALSGQGKHHIITSSIEHPSVLESCRFLARKGFEVTYLPVNRWGLIDPQDLENAIREDTGLVSIMMLNNEIGTRQDIPTLTQIAHRHQVLFHSDCVQQFAHGGLNVEETGVDLASISGHKFGAPVGIGLLYIRRGTPITPLIHGGGQQQGFRSGTEPAEAVEMLAQYMSKTDDTNGASYRRRVALAFVDAVQCQFPLARVNGVPFVFPPEHQSFREPSIISLCFPYVDGETLAKMLDDSKVLVSRGSACSSGEHHPSHVLKAIGLSDEDAMSSIRVSFPPDFLIGEADAVGRQIGIAATILEDLSTKS